VPTLRLAAYESHSSQELLALTKRTGALPLPGKTYCLSNSEIFFVKGSVMPASRYNTEPKPIPLHQPQAMLLQPPESLKLLQMLVASLLNTALFNNIMICTKYSFFFCLCIFLTIQLSFSHITWKSDSETLQHGFAVLFVYCLDFCWPYCLF